MLERKHGHHSGKNGSLHARCASEGDKAEVILVVEEKLSRDEIGTGGDFVCEETDIGGLVEGFGMALGETSDPTAKRFGRICRTSATNSAAWEKPSGWAVKADCPFGGSPLSARMPEKPAASN